MQMKKVGEEERRESGGGMREFKSARARGRRHLVTARTSVDIDYCGTSPGHRPARQPYQRTTAFPQGQSCIETAKFLVRIPITCPATARAAIHMLAEYADRLTGHDQW